MVIGAVLDLGYCLNLTDYESSGILKMGYELLKEKCSDTQLPQNKMGTSKIDLYRESKLYKRIFFANGTK